MDRLIKALQKLTAKVKQVNASPKKPSVTPPDMPAAEHETPDLGPANDKDPVKVTEQMTDPNQKVKLKTAKQNRESLSISRSGQWSLKSPSV